MSRLCRADPAGRLGRPDHPDPYGQSGTGALAQLRRERAELLSTEARKHWRLHRQRTLAGELRRITTELLKHEQVANTPPSALGDAGTAGGNAPPRLPYKD